MSELGTSSLQVLECVVFLIYINCVIVMNDLKVMINVRYMQLKTCVYVFDTICVYIPHKKLHTIKTL